jgi:hypothetical protein
LGLVYTLKFGENMEVVEHNKNLRLLRVKVKKVFNEYPDFYIYLEELLEKLGIPDYTEWETEKEIDQNYDQIVIDY